MLRKLLQSYFKKSTMRLYSLLLFSGCFDVNSRQLDWVVQNPDINKASRNFEVKLGKNKNNKLKIRNQRVIVNGLLMFSVTKGTVIFQKLLSAVLYANLLWSISTALWDTRSWNEDRRCCQAYPVCFIIVWIPWTFLKSLVKVMAHDFLLSIEDVACCYRKTCSVVIKKSNFWQVQVSKTVLDITWKEMLAISKIIASYWEIRKAVSVCM